MAEDIITISDDESRDSFEPFPKKAKKADVENVSDNNLMKEECEAKSKSNGLVNYDHPPPNSSKMTARKRMSSFTPKLTAPEEISIDIEEKPGQRHAQFHLVETQLNSFLGDIKDTMNDVEFAKVKSKLNKRLSWIGDCGKSVKMDFLITFIVKSCEKVVEKPNDVFNTIKKLLDEFARYQPKAVAKVEEKRGESSNDEQYKDQKRKAHIKKLELALNSCGKEIKKLEEAEMSVDDLEDEDSNYIKLDRYKRRYMKLLRKIDELRNVKTSLNRKCDKKFMTESSRIPEVNERIMVLVNKEKRFPDYADILGIYKTVNEVKGLGYSLGTIDDLGNVALIQTVPATFAWYMNTK